MFFFFKINQQTKPIQQVSATFADDDRRQTRPVSRRRRRLSKRGPPDQTLSNFTPRHKHTQNFPMCFQMKRVRENVCYARLTNFQSTRALPRRTLRLLCLSYRSSTKFFDSCETATVAQPAAASPQDYCCQVHVLLFPIC